MAKLILKLEVDGLAIDWIRQLKENECDYFPIKGKPNLISLDNAHMKKDPTETSFYLFEFIGVED